MTISYDEFEQAIRQLQRDIDKTRTIFETDLDKLKYGSAKVIDFQARTSYASKEEVAQLAARAEQIEQLVLTQSKQIERMLGMIEEIACA